MKSWLLISDFAFYLKVLRTAFRSFEGNKALEQVNYVIASSPDSVIQGAEDSQCELIFTDIHYNKTNGIGLLRELRRLNPSAKIVVVTHDLKAELEQDAISAGADMCFYKPRNREELKTLFMLLRVLVISDPQVLPAGDLYGLNLLDLVRFFHLKKASYVCKITRDSISGRVFFDKGVVTHVQCGELGGTEAFQKLLRLVGCEIELLPLVETNEGLVGMSTPELLRACRSILVGQRESDVNDPPVASTRRLKDILQAIDAESTQKVKLGYEGGFRTPTI